MLTRFHIAIALLYTPEFSSRTFFAGVFVIFMEFLLFCTVFSSFSDAYRTLSDLRTRLRHQDNDTVDVGVYDAGFFAMGAAEVAALAPGGDSQRRQRQ